MAAYDKRDLDKFKTDEAKNNFESIMYSFRDWLQTDENLPFVGQEDQERLLQSIMDNLEWLDYGDGDNASHVEYTKRYEELKVEQDKFAARVEEDQKRVASVEKARQKLADLQEKASVMREKKEWIKEEEHKDVVDKIQDAKQWLEDKMND